MVDFLTPIYNGTGNTSQLTDCLFYSNLGLKIHNSSLTRQERRSWLSYGNFHVRILWEFQRWNPMGIPLENMWEWNGNVN